MFKNTGLFFDPLPPGGLVWADDTRRRSGAIWVGYEGSKMRVKKPLELIGRGY